MLKEKIGYIAYKLSAFLFIVGVAALVWRRNKFIDFGVYVPTVKPSDILILLALLVVLVSLILSKAIRNNSGRNQLLSYWGKYLLIFIGFIVVGTLWAVFFLGTPLSKEVFLEWIRLGINIIGFFLVLFLGYNHERHVRFLVFAFISSLVLIPLLFLPESEILRHFLVVSPAGYVLLGFHPSTISLASFMITSIMLFFSFYFLEQSRRKYIFWAITLLLIAILIWSGSRIGWLSVFFGMMAIVAIKAFKEKGMRKIILRGLTAIILFFIFGFMILSRPARNTALLRIFPHLKVDVSLSASDIRKTPTWNFIQHLESIPVFWGFQWSVPVVDVGFKESRGEFWVRYFKKALLNPLGVGLGYESILGDKNITNQNVNAHNVWLQVALSAGIGGIIIFIMMLYKVGLDLGELIKKRSDPITYALGGAFIGTLFNSTFIDILDFRWFWIILGIIIVAHKNEKINVPHIDYPISKDINWFRQEIAQFYISTLQLFSQKGLSRIYLFKKINIIMSKYIRKGHTKFVYVDKNILYLDPEDSLGLSFQQYEPYTTSIISKFIRKGDVFVDVGAHIGYYTLLAAERVGASGKVFAFEPEKENFLLLQKNVILNGFTDRVILANRAVADYIEEKKLFICSINTGGHTLFDPRLKSEVFIAPHFAGDNSSDIDTEVVQSVTLDEFLGNKARVDFIKIDIQGGEGLALKGMLNILKNNPQVKLVSEFWPAGLTMLNSDPREYLNTFLQLGFTLYHIDEYRQVLTSINVDQLLKEYTPQNSKSINLFMRRN